MPKPRVSKPQVLVVIAVLVAMVAVPPAVATPTAVDSSSVISWIVQLVQERLVGLAQEDETEPSQTEPNAAPDEEPTNEPGGEAGGLMEPFG